MPTREHPPHHERIADLVFRGAVDLLDAGNVDGLSDLLRNAPRLTAQRVSFDDPAYFREPSLLEFVAENPIRHERLPPNIVDVARVILEAGAKEDAHAVQSTLGLVCSGRVARECGVQLPLISLLCDYGARPGDAMNAALGHGEFQAVQALIAHGGAVTLRAAAAMGLLAQAADTLAAAPTAERHLALAWAAQFGHAPILQLLIDAGEDPNRFNPPGAHAHSTPLHQAALAGHIDSVRLLVSRGARTQVEDLLWRGTPADWADHAGHHAIATYLRAPTTR